MFISDMGVLFNNNMMGATNRTGTAGLTGTPDFTSF